MSRLGIGRKFAGSGAEAEVIQDPSDDAVLGDEGNDALLPGDALLLPEDDFSFRCSYVDYDGGAVLRSWREESPRTPEEEEAFVLKHCPLIVDGVRYIGRYLEQIKEGRRSEHAA